MRGVNRQRRNKKTSTRLLITLAGLAGVAVIAIGGGVIAGGSADEGAAVSFRITSPVPGGSTGSPVPFRVELSGATLGLPTDGLDHLHISVDGGQTLAVYESPEPALNLAAGKHTLIAEVAGPDHRPLTAPQSVSFVVRP